MTPLPLARAFGFPERARRRGAAGGMRRVAPAVSHARRTAMSTTRTPFTDPQMRRQLLVIAAGSLLLAGLGAEHLLGWL